MFSILKGLFRKQSKRREYAVVSLNGRHMPGNYNHQTVNSGACGMKYIALVVVCRGKAINAHVLKALDCGVFFYAANKHIVIPTSNVVRRR